MTILKRTMDYPVGRNSGEYDESIISVGECDLRKMVVDNIYVGKYLKAIHPSAIISPRSTIGDGYGVMQGTIIQSSATIGNHCIVKTGASVGHDEKLADFMHVAPHSTLAGGVTVGEVTWTGDGTVVKHGIHIGRWSLMAVGSAVVDNTPSGVVAFVSKCKPIKSIN